MGAKTEATVKLLVADHRACARLATLGNAAREVSVLNLMFLYIMHIKKNSVCQSHVILRHACKVVKVVGKR